MHESTFKSLEELFTIKREPEAPVKQQRAPAMETLAALVIEAKEVMGRLERAIATFGGATHVPAPTQSKTVEGVFDGTRMIADDGTTHPVPENYASKSKLVEGDLLQYVETEDGRRYFKQISRAARATVTALLERIDQTGGIATTPNGRSYQLLHAPLRFFRVTPGDSITLEIPVDGGTWAAVVGKADACYTDAQRQSYARTLPNA